MRDTISPASRGCRSRQPQLPQRHFICTAAAGAIERSSHSNPQRQKANSLKIKIDPQKRIRAEGSCLAQERPAEKADVVELIMCTLITDGTYSTSGEPMKTTAVFIALALSPVALGNSQKEKEPTITTKDHLEEPPVDRIDPTESVVSDVAHNVYSAITHVERIGVVNKMTSCIQVAAFS